MSTNTLDNKAETGKGIKGAFKLEIITPKEVLLKTEADFVVAVTKDGELGVLPNHADLTGALDIGILKYKQGKTEEVVAVLGGVIEIKNGNVTVISDHAELAANIDVAKANQKAKHAEAELTRIKAKPQVDDRELMIAEHRLRKEMIKIQASNLRKKI